MACRPLIWIVSVGLLASLSGCHDGSSRSLLNPPAAAQPKMSLTTAEAIRKHNVNADKVQALQAKPSMTVSSPSLNGSVKGRMALERPRNFKLQMDTMSGTVADIGSNEREFWFWAKSRNKRDNAVLVCSYDDIDRSPLSAAFQPDWIVESMGLRKITAGEAERMTTSPGPTAGTITLVSTRRNGSGESLTKESIIDQAGNVKEHRLYKGEGRTKSLIADAVIMEYQDILTGEADNEKVSLPYKFRLHFPEQLTLDIQLDSARVVTSFTDEERKLHFNEPEIPGSKRVNLADYAAPAPPSSSARRASLDDPLLSLPTPKTRSSRPAPATGVQLEAPIMPDPDTPPSRGPISLSSDLDRVSNDRAVDQVVRPGLPRGVDP